jgi:hypothetical protein
LRGPGGIGVRLELLVLLAQPLQRAQPDLVPGGSQGGVLGQLPLPQ